MLTLGYTANCSICAMPEKLLGSYYAYTFICIGLACKSCMYVSLTECMQQ